MWLWLITLQVPKTFSAKQYTQLALPYESFDRNVSKYLMH